MSHARGSSWRGGVVGPALAGVAATLFAGCIPVLPPVNPGFVNLSQGDPGSADAQVQILGAGLCDEGCGGYLGGAAHFDIFAGKRDSVPVELSIYSPTEGGILAIPVRVGIRHRTSPGFAIGGGVGPAFTIGTEDGSVYTGASIDLDLVVGREFAGGALSAAFRPAFSFTPSDGTLGQLITLPIELSGVAWTSEKVGVGGTLLGGVGVYGYDGESIGFGSFGASLTLVFRHRPVAP